IIMSTKKASTRLTSHSHCPVHVTPLPQVVSTQSTGKSSSQPNSGIALDVDTPSHSGAPSAKLKQETVSTVPSL
ncbi:hypothetical protein FS837_010823, partial [Tulasnella sp. UAMH 9824]